MSVSAVIAAGGKGSRMGAGYNKVFMRVLDVEILARTMLVFEEIPIIDEIIVVVGEGDISRVRELAERYNITKLKDICAGGESRRESVYNGIARAGGTIIAVHDGARCLVSRCDIENVIRDCEKYGAAALGVKCKDTLKYADERGFIKATVDRSRTYHIQTPQVFKREIIIAAHKKAKEDNFNATDDCAAAERIGAKIKITEGSYDNIKITTPEDIPAAESILKRRQGCCV